MAKGPRDFVGLVNLVITHFGSDRGLPPIFMPAPAASRIRQACRPGKYPEDPGNTPLDSRIVTRNWGRVQGLRPVSHADLSQ